MITRRNTRPYESPFGAQLAKPPARALPAPQSGPAPGADQPADPGDARPARPSGSARTIMVGTRLDPVEVAKLDRLRSRIGGLVKATRPAALRWLLQTFDETTR